jgi:hypothetical protein
MALEESQRGEGGGVLEPALGDEPPQLRLGEPAADQARFLLVQIRFTGGEFRGEQDVEALAAVAVGGEQMPSAVIDPADSPVSSASSPRARATGSASGRPSHEPCGNSQYRPFTGYRYCSTRWNPPSAYGTTSAKSGFSTTP